MAVVTPKIPRHLMPQIPGDKLKEFITHMKESGFKVGITALPTRELSPVQAHVNKEKVEKLTKKADLLKKPLVVTSDGVIIDGHHRWLASVQLGHEKIPCIVVFGSVADVLFAAHDFDGTFVKSVNEVTTYSTIAFLQEYLPTN